MTKEEVAAAIRNMGESLIVIAEYVKENAADEAKAPAPEKKADEASKTAEPEIHLEDVRTVLSEISRSGHTAAMKELLAKHGAKKLSEVPIADYAQILAEAEEVKNAGSSQ